MPPRGAWWRREAAWLPAGLYSERNVKLSMALSVLGALVTTIAHGHLFTAFVFELYGSNASVGLVESVGGITALATALPAGLAVDGMSRPRLLRCCAALGLAAALSGALAVVAGPIVKVDGEPPGRAYTALLLASLALWGTFFNTSSSAALALFADSVPDGARRRDLYSLKSTITMMSMACGPLLNLLCTSLQGNSWSLQHTSVALLPGFALMPVMCALLTRFEEVGESKRGLSAPLLDNAERGRTGPSEAAPAPEPAPPAVRGAAAVPYLLLAAELITAIGAGMTVKFFGLWFKNVFNFTPAGLSLLQAATPLCIAVAVQALQRASAACPWGPVPAILAFWLVSIVLLLAMTQVTDWRVLVALHLMRTALANCKEPLARAILADFIPSKRRGRWNAVHSLTGVTWTGSAALGGILCDKYGYGKTFVITAGLYLCACAFWVPLIRLVPKDSKAKRPSIVEKAKGR